jgi:hypothetical protein
LCSSEALEFAQDFIIAWIGSLGINRTAQNFTHQDAFLETWLNGKYDLVWLERNDRRKLSKRMEQLGAYHPQCSYNLADFMENGHSLPREEWNAAGAALAYHYIVAWERESKQEKSEEKAKAAMAEGEDLGLGGLSFGGHAMDLGKVNWNAPLVKALLSEDTDVEDIEQPEGRVQGWLPMESVWNIMQMSTAELGNLLDTLNF